MRSDWPSVPTLGSRFAGLLSMIITSVSAPGLEEQAVTGRSRATAAPIINENERPRITRERVGPDALVLAFSARRIPKIASRIRDLPQNRGPLRSRRRRD